MLLSDAITFSAFRSLVCSMGIIIPDGHCDKETLLNIGFASDKRLVLLIEFFTYGISHDLNV